MKSKKIIIWIVVIVVVITFLNPSTEEFRAFIQARNPELSERNRNATYQSASRTGYYLLFSTYEASIDWSNNSNDKGKRVYYWGAVNNFFQIKK